MVEQHQEETFDAVEEMMIEHTGVGITTTTKFTVNMEASYRDVTKHILDINRDFKENMIKKVHTVKLNDQDILNKKVEELKSQEGKELQ